MLMSISMEGFFSAALAVMARVRETQVQPVRQAAQLLGLRLLNGGIVHVFGSGHSRAFAMELCFRAGGLMPMHAIVMEDLLEHGKRMADLQDPEIERNPANAHLLLGAHDIRPEDGFILVSNSGRNGMIVEMAMEIKRRNLPLVVVTALDHATRASSRHPSGRRLHELADVVIDNCGPYGDALLPVPGHGWNCCSISSITGACIAQSLTAELIALYLERNQTPPVWLSSNIDGGDVHNEALRSRYGGRV